MKFWNIYDEIDKSLKSDLLTIPPYYINYQKLEELLSAKNNPDNSTGRPNGEILRMISNPWQRSYQMEYRAIPSPIFKSSILALESATFDFMIGNHISSYLVLIPIIETLLREWAIDLEGVVNSTDSRGFNKFIFVDNLTDYLTEKSKTIHTDFIEWTSRLINHFKFNINKVFYLNFDDSNEGNLKEFNRNRTLHFLGGIDNPTVTRDNNIRIFLLIDIIAELYYHFSNKVNNLEFSDDIEENIDFNLRWNLYMKNALYLTTYTDMNIINFAFMSVENPMSDKDKLSFIQILKGKINFIINK